MSLTNGLVGTGFSSWYRIQPRVVVFKGLMVYLLIFCKQFMNWTKITDCSRQTTQRDEVYVQYMSTKININNNNNWRVQRKNRRCHKISVPELHPIVSIHDMFWGRRWWKAIPWKNRRCPVRTLEEPAMSTILQMWHLRFFPWTLQLFLMVAVFYVLLYLISYRYPSCLQLQPMVSFLQCYQSLTVMGHKYSQQTWPQCHQWPWLQGQQLMVVFSSRQNLMVSQMSSGGCLRNLRWENERTVFNNTNNTFCMIVNQWKKINHTIITW